MKLQTFYCPSCGGTVKFDVSSGRSSFFCAHCGQQIFIDDGVKRSEHKEIIEDKAKIQQSLTELELYKLKMEAQKQEVREDAKRAAICMGFLIFGFVFLYIFIEFF